MAFIRMPHNSPRLDDGPHSGRTDMDNHHSRVVVTDIEMPFLSMVTFMVKWALASIPAFLILSVTGFVIFLFLVAVNVALHGGRP